MIDFARSGKGSAGDLLGIQAIRADKRTILIARESSGDGLRREVIIEAGEVVQIRGKLYFVVHNQW
jgi:hypothetical protein